MRLAICTKYSHCEETYAAIRVAAWAESRGIEVEMVTVTDRTSRVDDHWDRAVRRLRPVQLAGWLLHYDAVVWTYLPAAATLHTLQAQRIKLLLIAFWRAFKPAHANRYNDFDVIVTPSDAASQLLETMWNVQHTCPIPWDAGLPITIKDAVPSGNIRVLFPLMDQTPNKTEMTAIHLIDRMLRATDVHVTVAYTPSQVRSAGLRLLHQMSGARDVSIQRSPTLAQRPFLFYNHDLTVWPTHEEDIGLVGLQSLAMGTPVVTFEVMPLPEFLLPDNSITVPCAYRYSDAGVPIANPDYNMFEDRLLSIINDPDSIYRMRLHTAQGLRERQQNFEESWDRILGVST